MDWVRGKGHCEGPKVKVNRAGWIINPLKFVRDDPQTLLIHTLVLQFRVNYPLSVWALGMPWTSLDLGCFTKAALATLNQELDLTIILKHIWKPKLHPPPCTSTWELDMSKTVKAGAALVVAGEGAQWVPVTSFWWHLINSWLQGHPQL